jgi:putative YpdA family bacillithiol system oxidoreductase
MGVRDLIIIGAGPSGLSAAIAAKQRGLDYQVIEQGVLVNSIFNFPPQMVFFTTPELLEIGGLPFVSPYDKPTRPESLRYYRKVVETYDLSISFEETVVSVEREQHEASGAGGAEGGEALFTVETRSSRLATLRPFDASTRSASSRAGSRDDKLRVVPGTVEGREPHRHPEPRRGTMQSEHFEHVDGSTGLAVDPERVAGVEEHGVRRVRHARNVIFAIGYYDAPNMLNVPGEDLPHVHHYYGEPHPYYRQRVVIVGGGNSAAEWALEVFRAGGHVTMVHRHPELKKTIKYWVRPDIENRIKEGSVAARFNAHVTGIRPTSVIIRSGGSGESVGSGGSGGSGEEEELPADAVFLLTGYHADWDLMERAGVVLGEKRVPTYDHETFETNVPGLFLAGGAICGRDTSNVFIENGRFHGEKIVETIARRLR